MATTTRATEADLLRTPRDGRKYELVDGEIRVSPAGTRHGSIIVRLTSRINVHVEAHDLGWAFDSSTGCWMPSGNLRVPDITFVAKSRLPDGPSDGFLRIVPDLVVEVLSPGDVQREIHDKVGEYLTAGVMLVWVIDPKTRTAAAHRSLTVVRSIAEDGHLDGEDLLPGFRCSLHDILS